MGSASRPERPLVDVLMATRDGERFLAEQVESLIYQTFGGVRKGLLIFVLSSASKHQLDQEVCERSNAMTRNPNRFRGASAHLSHKRVFS